MKPIRLAVFVFILIAPFAGYAQTEKREAVTGGSAVPSDSLGTLEVYIQTNPLAPGNWGNFFKEVLTLSFANTSYEARLKKKLVEGSSRFSADRIVKVVFWPDLDSGKFPDGKAYARGEMIRYRRFPAQA